MINPADYAPLDQPYEISFANVLYRPAGGPDDAGWYDGGDLDTFNFNLNPTRKQRWGKNRKTSYLAREDTTRIDSAITAKFMQKSAFIRAAALLGTVYDVQQAAGPVTANITNLVVGMFYAVGAYNVSAPAVQYTGPGGLEALPPIYWKLVDAALGIIQIKGLPADAVSDANGNCAGTVGGTVAPTDATKKKRIDVGSVPQVSLEVMVRGVSDVGEKGYLHIFQWNAAPDGEIGFITQNEDYEGVTIKGRAAVTGQGIGYWQGLDA